MDHLKIFCTETYLGLDFVPLTSVDFGSGCQIVGNVYFGMHAGTTKNCEMLSLTRQVIDWMDVLRLCARFWKEMVKQST